jgi:hypothetical protein
MKHIYRAFGIFGFILLGIFNIQAQTIDVLRDMADPNTKLFGDGKTDVTAYVNAVLASQTTCFGEDNMYIQVKLDDCGYSISVKALSGKKECMKKSVEDIVSYIRWNLTNPSKPGPIIFPIKIKVDSTAGKSNTYTKVAEPNGWTAIKQQVTTSRQGCTGGPKPETQPVTQNNANPTGNNPATNTNPTVNNTQPSQPGRPTMNTGGGQPLTAKSVDTTGLKKKMGPETLPDPVYGPAGNKNPDQSHLKTTKNEMGPQFKKPVFVDGASNMGVFIKTMYRRFSYCGYADVFAEVTVETDGTVSGYRLFKTNNDKVQALSPYVIGSLRFAPVDRKTNFYLQYQTDVDCDGFPRNPVDKTKFYFNSPDKAPRSSKSGDSPGDVLQKQMDE